MRSRCTFMPRKTARSSGLCRRLFSPMAIFFGPILTPNEKACERDQSFHARRAASKNQKEFQMRNNLISSAVALVALLIGLSAMHAQTKAAPGNAKAQPQAGIPDL